MTPSDGPGHSAPPPHVEAAEKGRADKPARREMNADELWSDLRQGARNVAGVTWQVNATTYLLVASFAGELPFVRITPEGFEDADCEHADGSRTHVQMKEVGAGDGRLAAAAVAEAIVHADESSRGATIALVTDGTLGSGLQFTGWAGVIEDLGDENGRSEVRNALVARGYELEHAAALLGRVRLVRLPYRVRELTELLLADAAQVHPTIAGIATSRLAELFADASAQQRRTTRDRAEHIQVADVEAALSAVLDAVDVDGLDEAVTAGICSPADFLTPDASAAQTFYLGVDGQPGHIAANLDVVRPIELKSCAAGLETERSVIIVGPSGSGKSVLLWRAARDLIPAARVVRVRRVQTAGEAAALARHVRLLRPTAGSPVLVVVDDLGRRDTLAWPDAAKQLREGESTYLLGAARAEDFLPAMLVGATRIVEPRLDSDTAHLIADRLVEANLDLKMAAEEATERSGGLLMEFVALLTTGQRLRQILAQQVAGLSAPGRELQRELARLVAAAHTLGLSLDADRLGASLTSAATASRVGDALSVLRDEHIVVGDGQTWSGLHELRSATLTGLLHDSPPPTLGATYARVAELVDPDHLGWMVRRVADRSPNQLDAVMSSVANLIGGPAASARRVALLLEGAERSDNTLYARAALPVLQEHLPAALSVEALAMLTYPVRNQGVTYGPELLEIANGALRRVVEVAERLPARVDFDTTLRTATGGLSRARVDQLLDEAEPVDGVRLLEAGRSFLQPSADALGRLLKRTAIPRDALTAMHRARVIAACAAHLPQDSWDSVIGSLTERAQQIVAADACALRVDVDPSAGTVRVERIAPTDPEVPPLMEWDLAPKLGADALNNETVGCLQRLVDACPELQTFQMITMSPSGRRYRVGGHEPGYKDMHRSAFPDRASVRQSVGFQAALRRATSSATWTEVVTSQIAAAAELTELSREVPVRFKPDDNSRRRNDWNRQLQAVREHLASLGTRPKQQFGGLGVVQAQADDADRSEDIVTGALAAVADAMHNLLVDDPATDQRPLVVAISLRSAIAELRQAKDSADTVLDHRGSTLPDDLIEALASAANLAAALAIDRQKTRRIRSDQPGESALEIYISVCEEAMARRETLLATALVGLDEAKVHRVTAPDPADWALDESGWLVTIPFDLLDEALEALEALTDPERDLIGSQVVLLATATDESLRRPDQPAQDVPTGLSADDVSLGIGIQLSHEQSRPSLPLPSDLAVAWAQAASLPTLSYSPEATRLIDLLNNLVELSWSLARNRMRTVPDLGEFGVAMTVDELVEASRIETVYLPEDASLDDLSERDLATGLLVEQLHAEETGDDSVVLAGLIVDSIGNPPIDPYEQNLLGAMAVIHVSLVTDIDL